MKGRFLCLSVTHLNTSQMFVWKWKGLASTLHYYLTQTNQLGKNLAIADISRSSLSSNMSARTFLNFTFFFIDKRGCSFNVPCNESFAVKQFLLDSHDLAYTRSRFYQVNSLKGLFNSTTICKFINYLKDTGLYLNM